MKNMFKKIMTGRYGFDYYTLILFLLALMFLGTRFLWVIGIAIIGYALFRIFSRNTDKRLKELNGFMRIFNAYIRFIYTLFGKIGQFFRFQKRRLGERKTAVFIRCPQCKKTLRLPRNKGMLEVSCPVCSNSFNRKT